MIKCFTIIAYCPECIELITLVKLLLGAQGNVSISNVISQLKWVSEHNSEDSEESHELSRRCRGQGVSQVPGVFPPSLLQIPGWNETMYKSGGKSAFFPLPLVENVINKFIRQVKWSSAICNMTKCLEYVDKTYV